MPKGKLLLAEKTIDAIYVMGDRSLSFRGTPTVGIICLDNQDHQLKTPFKEGDDLVLQLAKGTQINIRATTFWDNESNISFRALVIGKRQ
jgi:hypothetical protein